MEPQSDARGRALSPALRARARATASRVARCPLCGESVDRRFLDQHERLERRVIARLRAEHDRWRPEQGACPACAARAVESSDGAHDPAPYGRAGEILSLPSRLRPDPSYLGRGVTVAFLDADFVFHPDLLRPKRRIVTYVDARGARPRANAKPAAPWGGSWHGTMTSGSSFGSGWISGGRYPGLAPLAEVVLVRIAEEKAHVGEKEILRGLRWVLANHRRFGIRVVNLSVGGDEPGPSAKSRLDRLVATLVAYGVVIVVSAGNRPDRPLVAPASAPQAITVGGVDDFGRAVDGEARWWPSTHGPTVDGVEKPDVLAPSIWVPAPMVPRTPQAREAALLFELDGLTDALLMRTLERRIEELPFPKEILRLPAEGIRGVLAMRRAEQKFITPAHQHVDGTSFAAPIVTATVAQMLEANPSLEPLHVKGILMGTARPLRDVPRELQGAGVVQPGAAAREALRAKEPGAFANVSPTIESGRVRYVLVDGARTLERVEWAGSLDDWKATPMKPAAPGVWVHEHPRPAAGEHVYKFLLPDGRWISDPMNPRRVADGFGGWNSVLVVRR